MRRVQILALCAVGLAGIYGCEKDIVENDENNPDVKKAISTEGLASSSSLTVADPRIEARALLIQRKYREALGGFEKARRLYPRSGEILFGIGRAHLALVNSDSATQFYEMGIALEPYNPALLIGMGNFHLKYNRYEEAGISFRSALAIDSTKIVALRNLAAVLAKQGRLADASKEYERALELVPAHIPT